MLLRWALVLLLLLPGLTARAEEGDFRPATFYGLPAPLLRGAEAARGLVIWTHGTDALPYIDQAPVLAWYFAQAGWDVYRLYRGPEHDRRQSSVRKLETGLATARALGYRRIVLMGHSAGGWAAVETLARDRADADDTSVSGVIALAPAAFGHAGNGVGWELNDHGMRPFWRRLAPTALRIAVAYFPQDVFYDDEMPGIRGAWLRNLLQTAGSAHAVVDAGLPAPAGHGSGLGWHFARRYGACFLQLMDHGGRPDCAALATAGDAAFAAAVPPEVARLVQAYEGRWREDGGAKARLRLQILRDDLGMPLLAITDRMQGHTDWPLLFDAAGTPRSETGFGMFEMRRDGARLRVTLSRPGDAGGDVAWLLRREPADQLLSSLDGLNSSATPLMQ